MANPQHVKVVLAGTDAIAEWRIANPGTILRLEDADLSNLDLSGADLNAARLRRANLSAADLNGAVLDRADFGRANLSGADLSGASLLNAQLNHARIDAVDFSGAGLDGANLGGALCDSAPALFPAASLQRVSLDRASLPGTDWTDADLREANFDGADLRGAKLYRAKLRDAKLETAKVDQAEIDRLDLEDVREVSGKDPYCGLSMSQRRSMKIRDGYESLQAMFGGLYAWIYLVVALSWLAPHVFLIFKAVVLDLAEDTIPGNPVIRSLWVQLWGYAKSGLFSPECVSGEWLYPLDPWHAARWWLLFLCNSARMALVYRVKTLEHGQRVTGLHPIVSLETWQPWLTALKILFVVCLFVALWHAHAFLQTEFPATFAR